MSIAVGTRLGPYEILSPLGAGGMGEVWKARDTRLDRLVAVKVLPRAFSDSAEALARFEREAKAVAALSHPGIVGIFDFGKAEGLSYAAMELLEGQTLRERMRSGPLPPRRVLDFGLQIAEALAAAHGKGIVHRDLKPENLWITTAGRIKILDFGLAKQVESPPAGGQSRVLTQTIGETEPGTILGTVGYMSPEQVRSAPSDARSDLFSLGVVLYEMLSGRTPFRGDTPVQTMNAILEKEAPELTAPMGTLPPALERIVAHCLEKEPSARFQSAGDLAFALAGLSGERETEPSPPVRAPIRESRLPARALSAGALLALAGAAAGWLLKPASTSGVPAFAHITVQQRRIQDARIAPDGVSVIFSAVSPDGRLGVYATSRDGEATRDLGIRDARLCAVSPRGELAILLVPSTDSPAGTLAIVPVGGGIPKEIANDVTDADWGPDGSELAAAIARSAKATTRDSGSRLEFPLGRSIYETGNLIDHPRISPDGRSVVFMEHSEQGGDLTVVDREGGRKVVVAHLQGETGRLCWSPGGREVLFTELLEGDRTLKLRAVDLRGRIRDLYRDPSASRIMDVDRSGVVLLRREIIQRRIFARAPGESAERDLSWPETGAWINLSKDGRQLAFVTMKENLGFRSQVHVRDLAGTPPKLLGEGAQPTFDWEGKSVGAITTDYPSKLILMPTGIGQPRTIAIPGLFAVRGGGVWRDGRTFAIWGQPERGKPFQAFLFDEKTSSLRSLWPGYALLAPDLKRILTMDPESSTLLLHDLEKGTRETVCPLEAGETITRPWSSDGRFVYLLWQGPDHVEVRQIELATRQRTLWRRFERRTGEGWELEPTSISISPDTGAYAYCVRRDELSDLFLMTLGR